MIKKAEQSSQSSAINDLLNLWKSQDGELKYIAAKVVASRVRRLIKLSMQELALPQDLKVSVRSSLSSLSITWSIGSTNRISESPIWSLDLVDGRYKFTRTDSYEAIEEYLTRLAKIWQIATGYFDINYYVRVSVDWKLSYNIKNTVSKELNFEELETLLILHDDAPYPDFLIDIDDLVLTAKALCKKDYN